MTDISKSFELSMAHRLPNHDGHCRRLHGHTYKVDLMIGGGMNIEEGSPKQGMVIDFNDVKALWADVHEDLDHHTLFWREDPMLRDLKIAVSVKENIDIDELGDVWTAYLEEGAPPTAEYIASTLFNNLFPHMLPLGGVLRAVRVWETSTSWALCDGTELEVSKVGLQDVEFPKEAPVN
jgi:6-pyruvoyltetrahydropterin/6-carboxytetrahydropterin synthase